MFYVKVHNYEDGELVAICDKELIGMNFSDGDFGLNITERFYKGELKDKEDVIFILQNSKNTNVVGNQAVKLCVELGLITEEDIIKIQDTAHALIINI